MSRALLDKGTKVVEAMFVVGDLPLSCGEFVSGVIVRGTVAGVMRHISSLSSICPTCR